MKFIGNIIKHKPPTPMNNTFHIKDLISGILERIREKSAGKTISLMEVCGTHTMAISSFGLRGLLPNNIRLISGPGCPVCVTPNSLIDRAVAIAKRDDCIVTTFGDMMRVPGSSMSLSEVRSLGGDVRIVYSTMDAIRSARDNPDKKVIFLGIGFETTAPTVAASILTAHLNGVRNYSVLCAHKVMPPTMETLVLNKKIAIDGFICPGHVSTIIGSKPYLFLAEQYYKACVIAGFEPLDVSQAIEMLVNQIIIRKPAVEIQYTRAVKPEGNPSAMKVLHTVFEPCDAEWRGIGVIPGSGLKIRDIYSTYDAEKVIPVTMEPLQEQEGCICGEILQGIKLPSECSLFKNLCTPERPIGACMVSSEGTCAAYYKYGV